MYHILSIHSSVEEHLGPFQLLLIINKAAVNIVEHVFALHGGEFFCILPVEPAPFVEKVIIFPLMVLAHHLVFQRTRDHSYVGSF